MAASAGRILKKRNLSRPDTLLAAGQFFGETRGQLRTAEFTVTAVRHDAARRVPRHVHSNPFFSMLIGGSYREWFGPDQWDARPLGMVLRPPQSEHEDEIGPGGATFLCVDVAQDFWDSMAKADIRLERRAFEDRPMSASALRLFGELCEKRPGWEKTAEALIIELIDEYRRAPDGSGRREPRWLQRAMQRLREEPSASLVGIASELDLHPVHVSRMFKRHFGVTMSRYLKQLRLQQATRAVLETGEPLSGVACRLGYADQSHLTRTMQQETGWTPGRLRCACEQFKKNDAPALEPRRKFA